MSTNANSVYLYRRASGEYRVYMPTLYQGPTPDFPQWQCHFLMRDYFNHDTASPSIPVIGSVLQWHAPAQTNLVRDTATTHMISYAPTDWSLFQSGGSADTVSGVDWDGSTTNGTDDGEVSGKSSATAIRTRSTAAAGTSATLTVTVPSDYKSGVLDLTFHQVSGAWNAPGKVRFELYYNDSGTYRRIPLTGRGCAGSAWLSTNADSAPMYRGVRVWNSAGEVDTYSSGSENMNVELARNLKAGATYKVKMVQLDTGAANRMAIGRARIFNGTPDIRPGDSGWRHWLLEAALDSATVPGGASDPARPGPYWGSWMSSVDYEIKHNSDSEYANGPNYGSTRQTAWSFTVDGSNLAPANGTLYGPYSSVVFSSSEDLVRKTATTDNTTSTRTATTDGTATVTFSGALDLSGVSAGDYIKIASRTDGIDSTAWYPIASVGASSVVLGESYAPGAASGQAWSIYSKYATLAKTYTFTGGKMTFACTTTFTKATTVARLYVANWRAATLYPSANWYGYMGRHPANVFPYRCTRITYWPYEFNTGPVEYILSEASKTTGGTAGVYDGVAIVDNLVTPNPPPLGFVCKRRIWHYDAIEGGHIRGAARILVMDSDYDTWTGTNYKSLGYGSWHTQGDDHKAYMNAVSGTSYSANDTIVVNFTLYVAEPNYFDPPPAPPVSLGRSVASQTVLAR